MSDSIVSSQLSESEGEVSQTSKKTEDDETGDFLRKLIEQRLDKNRKTISQGDMLVFRERLKTIYGNKDK